MLLVRLFILTGFGYVQNRENERMSIEASMKKGNLKETALINSIPINNINKYLLAYGVHV